MARYQLNTPRVMFERLVYSLHIALFVSAVFLAVSTFVNGVVVHGLLCSACLGGAYALRKWGKAKLNFIKHERSIDASFAREGVEVTDFEDCVHALYILFERLENEPMSPASRQALRKRIIELLKEDERLAHYYRERLRQRHPYLLNAF